MFPFEHFMIIEFLNQPIDFGSIMSKVVRHGIQRIRAFCQTKSSREDNFPSFVFVKLF